MAYLLDTTTISFVLKGNRIVDNAMRTAIRTDKVYTSVITEGELLAGALRMGQELRVELQEETRLLLADLAGVLPITRQVAARYGELRCELEAQGKMMAVNDLWIAAVALLGGFTLVTDDADFDRVRSLTLVNWLKP